MADRNKRLAENVSGEFFVDSTCIDCDACRQLAPEVFADSGEFSFVHAQPQNEGAVRNALRALLACPTGSIGTLHPNRAREVKADFPLPLAEGLFYCGFNSPKSFGGNSYFLRHFGGNWLIDSPKFLPPLVDRFKQWGGIEYIFLTPRDDVAEAAKFAQQFSARRIIHRLELSSQPGAEIVIDGEEPVEIAPQFLVIPTPGHTRGHCCLLYDGKYLFTGDHLWWSRTKARLNAGRDVCWHSWTQQTRSMALLEKYAFEWVLPGHGQRVQQRPEEMRRQIAELVTGMRTR
jgi:glyoxylase-like metal-dependent hydrolase (beta-lactamase superfamily II)/ferredoxin